MDGKLLLVWSGEYIEASALPSASPVCEPPVAFPRFAAAMTPSVALTGGVCVALTKGEVLALLRWKLDMGGRLALMFVGETECGG